MIINFLKPFFRKTLPTLCALGIGLTSYTSLLAEPIAYYGDYKNDRVFALKPRAMTIANIIDTIGLGPYPPESVSDGRIYVSTRDSESVDIVENATLSLIGTLPLQHKPRSLGFNSSKNLAAISGGDKAMTTIVDTTTDQIVAVVGDPAPVTPTDYGGSLATGHPFWVNNHKFLMLDRANRKIHLYKLKKFGWGSWTWWKAVKLSSVNTPSSIHIVHSIPGATGSDKNKYYAAAEGAPNDGIHPSILEFKIKWGWKLKVTNNIELNNSPALVMGSHHLDMHPDGIHMYQGSREGELYVVNRLTGQTVSIISTGSGTGHTTFVPDRNVAVVTNHKDTFMTVIDTNTHTKITDITVTASTGSPGQNSQTHTSSFDPDNSRFFYTMASDEGNFVELDLDSNTVSRTISLSPGGYPIMGNFIWDN